jgi:outer membrane protein assembly factor BamB
MNILNTYLWNIGNNLWVAGTLAVLGVLLLCLAAVRFLRLAKPNHSGPTRLAWPLGMLILGLACCGLVGMALWKHPQALKQLFREDFVDASKLQGLQAADLTSAQEAPVVIGDWPQWRGPRRDGISLEAGLRLNWPAGGPPILWRKPIQGGYSSCAVVQGRLYTMDRTGPEERVLCFDAVKGDELWTHRYPANYSIIDMYGEGPRATPTVHEDRVYTVGATGIFLCLEARPADGQAKVHWQHDLVAEFDGLSQFPRWGIACSPLIEGDLVIVQPGGTEGSVAAFDRRSGKLVWKALSDASGYSSPMAATLAGVRQIICFTGEGLVGLRAADGGQLWYYPWPEQYNGNIATPIVAGDYVFISTGYGMGCALLHVSADGGNVRAEPVYFKKNKVMRNHHSTSVLHGGHLYGFDLGLLKCVDIRTAEEKWVSREPGKGSLIYAEGHLIALTEDGKLALVEATPVEYRQKGAVELLEGPHTWALPALASGRLYVRNQKELVCLDLKK